MKRLLVTALVLALAQGAGASWYWPFGSEGGFTSSEPRISELMEPIAPLVDEATDLADEGKVNEAIEKYREVLVKLDELERTYPVRAKTSEFSTVRSKRAYVNARIDSMLMNQVRTNAKVVSVSDTRELEEKLVDERWSKAVDGVRRISATNEAEAVSAVVRAVKVAMQKCSNDVQVVVTCHAGAAKFCEFADFDRAIKLLDFARTKCDEEKILFLATNVTEVTRSVKVRLKAAEREVKNELAVLALSDRTNRVEFCEGLRKVADRLAEFRKWRDRVIGGKAAEAREEEKPAEKPTEEKRPVEKPAEEIAAKPAEKAVEKAVEKPAKKAVAKVVRSKRDQAIEDISNGDYDAAALLIREMLEAKPNNATALNLRAALEMKQGRLDDAEETLDQAIMSNGNSYFAYYNMARLMLMKNADDRNRAKKFYDAGREKNGPKDAALEELLK